MARLRLPLRFRTEEHAEAAIEAASLYPTGARPVFLQGRWYIAIATDRPDRILPFLKNHMLGHEWIVEGVTP